MTRSLLSGTFIVILLCAGLFSYGSSTQPDSIPDVINEDITKASLSTNMRFQMPGDSLLRAGFIPTKDMCAISPRKKVKGRMNKDIGQSAAEGRSAFDIRCRDAMDILPYNVVGW